MIRHIHTVTFTYTYTHAQRGLEKLKQMEDGWDTLKVDLAEARAAANRAERTLAERDRQLDSLRKQVLCMYVCMYVCM